MRTSRYLGWLRMIYVSIFANPDGGWEKQKFIGENHSFVLLRLAHHKLTNMELTTRLTAEYVSSIVLLLPKD